MVKTSIGGPADGCPDARAQDPGQGGAPSRPGQSSSLIMRPSAVTFRIENTCSARRGRKGVATAAEDEVAAGLEVGRLVCGRTPYRGEWHQGAQIVRPRFACRAVATGWLRRPDSWASRVRTWRPDPTGGVQRRPTPNDVIDRHPGAARRSAYALSPRHRGRCDDPMHRSAPASFPGRDAGSSYCRRPHGRARKSDTWCPGNGRQESRDDAGEQPADVSKPDHVQPHW